MQYFFSKPELFECVLIIKTFFARASRNCAASANNRKMSLATFAMGMTAPSPGLGCLSGSQPAAFRIQTAFQFITIDVLNNRLFLICP